MTDETQSEWVAEMPGWVDAAPHRDPRANAAQALVTKCNAELAKVRAERDSAVSAVKALGTELDKLRFARDVARVGLKEARARIAELEAASRSADADVCWHCLDCLEPVVCHCNQCPPPGECDDEGCLAEGCLRARGVSL